MDYAALAAGALDALAEAGQTVTLRAYSSAPYDPANGSASTTYTDTSRIAVVLDFGSGQTMTRGSLIQGGDKRLLLEATGSAPTLKDHFIIGGVEYVIVSIGEINPAGTPVLYDLHLTT
jgi:hypothetical protein